MWTCILNIACNLEDKGMLNELNLLSRVESNGAPNGGTCEYVFVGRVPGHTCDPLNVVSPEGAHRLLHGADVKQLHGAVMRRCEEAITMVVPRHLIAAIRVGHSGG